jgi:hypothetical protein
VQVAKGSDTRGLGYSSSCTKYKNSKLKREEKRGEECACKGPTATI